MGLGGRAGEVHIKSGKTQVPQIKKLSTGMINEGRGEKKVTAGQSIRGGGAARVGQNKKSNQVTCTRIEERARDKTGSGTGS